MKNYVARLKPEEYLRRYLVTTPLALALFRSIEAKNIAQVKMQRPILDLGCGFGEFAGVFFESQVEMGIDISWRELLTAKKGNKYKKLKKADARKLPFKNESFNTVLSVSTLEHIKKVEKVISETKRVLKPGGKFVFTVNSNKINNLLFFPKFLRKLGFDELADFYIQLFHKVFKHETLYPKRKWESILEKEGFKIKVSREIISPTSTKIFEVFLLTAWPSQLFKLCFGWRWAWRPKWFREFLVSHFAKFVKAEEKKGSNLFFVASLPAGRHAGGGFIKPR